MDFLENLWNRARGIDSTQDSREDQGGSQQLQRNQHQPAERMQYEENEALDSDYGGKEIRTYRREGINVIEDYERLNPDGTVTKTISTGDKKNGLKKFEVYKMDKSGIVRRLESASKGDVVGPEAMRESWMANLRMSNNLKERVENQYVEQPNTYESSYNSKHSTNAKQYLNSLSPEQRTAMFNQFKERLFTYSTDKLKSVMIPKLDRNGKELGLTDLEKVQILEAGIQKLRRRLNESVNEEKFFTEVWPRYGLYKNRENDGQDSSTTQVSFALQPNNNWNQNGSSGTKPISFVIRPEYGTPSYSESEPQRMNTSVEDQNNAFVNNIWEDEKVNKYQTKEFTYNEPKAVQNISFMELIDDTLDKLNKHLKRHINEVSSTNEKEKQVKVKSLEQILHLMKKNLKSINLDCGIINDDPLVRNVFKRNGKEESVNDLIDKLHTILQLSIKYDPSINKEEKIIKEDFFDIALETLKNKIRQNQTSVSEEHDNRKAFKIDESKSKEEKSKKNDFDLDEAYDYGLKALKKIFKKTLSGQKKDEFLKQLKDQDSSSKRKCVKDDVPYEKQRKIRNDDIYEEEDEIDFVKGLSSERNKPFDILKTFIKRFDDTPSSNERENRKLVESHSELKSKSLGRKESEYSNDNNRYAQKYQPESTTETQSKFQNIEDDKHVTFDMNTILRKMRNLLGNDEGFKESNSKSNYNDNYNPQYRQLEVNRKDDSLKENKSESIDFNNVISKLRESLSQRANKQIDSTPKQVRYSSPYSYKKPPHGTTKIKPLGTHQNQHNNISFRIQPQENSKANDSSSGNRQIYYNESRADDDKDSMPWWFGNTPHLNSIGKNVTKEPLIQAHKVANSLSGNSIFNDSFFDNFLGQNVPKLQIT